MAVNRQITRSWTTKSGDVITKTYSYDSSRYGKASKLGEQIVKAKRKDYKTEEEWIRATYAKNKAYIDRKILEDDLRSGIQRNPNASYEEEFISAYEGYRDNYKAVAALRQLSRSTMFTPYTVTAKRNIVNAMMAEGSSWEEFKRLSGVRGIGSLDLDMLKWSKNDSMYTYELKDGSVVRISIQNSPYGIEVTKS